MRLFEAGEKRRERHRLQPDAGDLEDVRVLAAVLG
jgi:hypothetical protein